MKDLDALIRSEHKRQQVDSTVKSFVHYMAEAMAQSPVRRAELTEHTLATARLEAELMRQLLESRIK
ncbi:hypothetical protein [Erwinia phage vB_Ea277G]|jgi:hypothetical protein|nr:hypothetical protein [Erwinia phage vB_Ea277G]